MKYFDQKNLRFYSFLENTFSLKKCKTWDDVAKQITLEKIGETYKFFSKLFPTHQNYLQYFKESEKFSTLHYGSLKGNNIINDIVRFSLYSEEIYVFHPLQNPSITNAEFNPIKKTNLWVDDFFLSALYFYIVLKKWVEVGIVKLIINPISFDFKLQNELLGLAKQRVIKTLSDNPNLYEERKDHQDDLAEYFANYYGDKSVDELKNMLLNIQTPKFTIIEAQEFAERISKSSSGRNPLYQNLKIKVGSGLASMKTGGNAEEITYISKLIGSNIYTSRTSTWTSLKELAPEDFWTKANYIHSKTNFNFLSNVDTSFVLNLRKETV